MIPEALIQRLAKYTPQWAELLQKYGIDALKASVYINCRDGMYENYNSWNTQLDIVSCVRKHDIFGKHPDMNDHECCIVGEFHAKRTNAKLDGFSGYACRDCTKHSMQLWRPVDPDNAGSKSNEDIESEFVSALTDFLNHVEEVHA